MLDNLPHDQAFSQLIITQMVSYYDKCYGWYKTLVTRAQEKKLKASAALRENQDVSKKLAALLEADDTNREDLLNESMELVISVSNYQSLKGPDLINDRKNVAALCLLYTSMKWLASKVQSLRHISDRATDSSRPDGGRQQHRRRWTNVGSVEPRGDGNPVFLPLNQETAVYVFPLHRLTMHIQADSNQCIRWCCQLVPRACRHYPADIAFGGPMPCHVPRQPALPRFIPP